MWVLQREKRGEWVEVGVVYYDREAADRARRNLVKHNIRSRIVPLDPDRIIAHRDVPPPKLSRWARFRNWVRGRDW